jgi:hypothetical protein
VADQAAPEDVDWLSRVIRSLEAEIGGGGPPPSASADDWSTAEQVLAGDVGREGLEEYMLSDLDSILGAGALCGVVRVLGGGAAGGGGGG